MWRPTLLAVMLAISLAHVASAQQADGCANEGLITGQISCYRDAALQSGRAQPCLEADDAAVRFQCVSLFAERRQDVDACALLDGDDPEAALHRNTCRAGVAIAAIDPALCEGVSPRVLADSCFAQLVLERGADLALCERVENPLLRNACLEAPPQ